ncbi:hypothetical protein [Burkholderia vietnamiensis]|uniref:hypothetical protein n=1 Tax=Burkholderia vietnamiensis TaxID=60552 RepID=UPI001B8DCB5B|nr:hypothetical protein [Burkholderia vietnamiensis]MBR8007127.1 hypothetical protein [Burkholderia vietnamiensis]
MPSLFTFANNISTTLAGSISSAATSLTLSSAANLPSSIPAGKVLVITLNDVATRQQFEVIYATSISGATLSGLLRGQENTSAQAWSTGDYAYTSPTMGQMQSFGQLAGRNTWSGLNEFDGGASVPNNIPYLLTSSAGTFSALYCTPSDQVQVGNPSYPTFVNSAPGGNVFGIGQTKKSPARSYNTIYTNNTPAPIIVSCNTSSTGTGSLGILVDGFEFTNSTTTASGVALCVWAIVPSGSTYEYVTTGSVSGSANFVEYS